LDLLVHHSPFILPENRNFASTVSPCMSHSSSFYAVKAMKIRISLDKNAMGS